MTKAENSNAGRDGQVADEPGFCTPVDPPVVADNFTPPGDGAACDCDGSPHSLSCPVAVAADERVVAQAIDAALEDGRTRRARVAQLGLVADGAELAPARLSSTKSAEGTCEVCARDFARCLCDQYHTPPKLADRALSLVYVKPYEGAALPPACDVPRVVLDLGAGGGALVDAALRAGARLVVAVERDPRWVAYLRARYARDERVRVVDADVDALASMGEREACARLGLDAPADVVVSNPAFKGGGFVRFALAAIVLSKVGAPCVFIGPIVALPTVTSLSLWNVAELADLAVCSRRPEYGNEVKKDGGAQEDFIAVRFSGCVGVGETHHGVRVHFWSEAWS